MVRLNNLKTFVHVVENQSFSKVAEQLKLTQGTISNHIIALEDFFKVPLLTRSAKGVFLTENGKILYGKAKRIIEEIEETRRSFENKNIYHQGLVKIAASTIPSEHILPQFISEFKKEHPDVNFKIEVTNSNHAWDMLKNNKVDLAAVGTMQAYNSKKYEKIKILDEDLVLIVPCKSELAKQKTVSLKEVLKHPYINREEGSGTRVEVELFLKKNDIPPDRLNTVIEAGSTESVIASVSEETGISIISSIAAKKAEARGLVKTLSFDVKAKRNFYLVLRKKDVSPAARAFWNFQKKSI